MNLKDLFIDISEQMSRDFTKAQKAVTHSGLKGSANERTLKSFLQQYLPRALDISGGQLVDSNGNSSKQIDIILSDSTKTPIMFESGETRVIPIECAYAVIEVKAYLDKEDLLKSYENMKSVKSLEKIAFFEEEGPVITKNSLYGKKWSNWPIQYFVFAFDSPNLKSVKENLDKLQNIDAFHQRIDSICVLDKGIVINIDENGIISALPGPGKSTIIYRTNNALLVFYVLISTILNQVRMRNFNILHYMRNIDL